ncbi:MAG: Holliday junction resolvase RuvX [Bacteroidales bacterium]|nr:Holliday junction resolvase RuvX [Bacteroidales bacterium]
MGRILAIDYGRKRVGVAVTDTNKSIAFGLTTVPTHKIFDFINEYLNKEIVDCIIIGYPKQLNNKPSEAIIYINPFIKKLKKIYPDILIELEDERFTSKMAVQTMIDSGLKKKDRQNKALVDEISATIILQSYLERQNILNKCN